MSAIHKEIEGMRRRIRELEFRLARYDDPRPITEELLRGMGFDYSQLSKNYLFKKIDEWSQVLIHVPTQKVMIRYWPTTENHRHRNIELPHIKTIGQLTHLLDALGVSGGDGGNNE